MKAKEERNEPKQRLDYVRKWCSLQERCTQDVREKLRQRGAHSEEVEAIVATLREENYLNDQRFAEAFVRARAVQKRWGPTKIQLGLRAKGISSADVMRALDELESNAFEDSLATLAEKRKHEIPEGRDRVIRWLISRGFSLSSVLRELERMDDSTA